MENLVKLSGTVLSCQWKIKLNDFVALPAALDWSELHCRDYRGEQSYRRRPRRAICGPGRSAGAAG